MSFPISVLDPTAFPTVVPRRVTLIRFARAVTGFADSTAPDLDNRGGGLIRTGHGASHGPVVGLLGNSTGQTPHEIRIRIMRDRIEPTVQLFPELDGAITTQEFPPPGQALNPADVPATSTTPERKADCVYLKANSDGSGNPETKLKIRHGSITGPILGEMGIVVYQPITMFVRAHLVTINGIPHPLTPAAAAPTTSAADIQTIVRRMARIYAQAGIRVILRSTIRNDTVNGFTEAGTVTLTATADQLNQELQTVLNTNKDANSMNMYVFNQFRDILQPAGSDLGVLGVAFSRDDARRNPPVGTFPGTEAGFTLAGGSGDLFLAAHTMAHEVGHSLRLQHYANRGNLNQMLDEIWANRNLMKNTMNMLGVSPLHTVAYGNFADGSIRNGSWLGTKTIPTAGNLGQCDQINLMRQAANNNSYKPVRP
jgi:hypothetical protein